MRIINHKESERGQSLIEILFAIGIIGLIGVAIVSLAVVAVRNNTYARDKTRANQYAVETIEFLRKVRNESWSDLHARTAGVERVYCTPELIGHWWDNSSKCAPDGTDTIIDDDGNPTIFYREIILNRIVIDESLKATVRIYWIDPRGILYDESDPDSVRIHKTYLHTIFTNWRNDI